MYHYWCYQKQRFSREEISKREEASTWSLGTKFVVLLQKRILGHIEVVTKKVY
jgi:hypothetical protein